jgi:hypothetical protein
VATTDPAPADDALEVDPGLGDPGHDGGGERPAIFASRADLENLVVHLHHVTKSEREVSRRLKIARNTIHGILERHRQATTTGLVATLEALNPKRAPRSSKLDAFKEQIHAIMRKFPDARPHKVREVFVAEQPQLLPLPADSFPCDEKVEVHIPKTPYAQFDLNRYSVPHAHVQRTLGLVASLHEVRILGAINVVATHKRSYDKDQRIEDPVHIRELEQQKTKAREHRGMGLLHHAVPQSQELLRAVAERGDNLGSTTSALLRLLRSHGADALNAAIQETLAQDVPTVSAVRHLLDAAQQRREAPPPLPLALPDDARVRDAVVRTHDLSTYDQIKKDTDDDNQI